MNEISSRSKESIEIWLALHAVICWWNENPIKNGALNLDRLEEMMSKSIPKEIYQLKESPYINK